MSVVRAAYHERLFARLDWGCAEARRGGVYVYLFMPGLTLLLCAGLGDGGWLVVTLCGWLLMSA